MPQLQRYSPTKLCDGAKMTIFLRPVFSASRVQHISDMHSKLTLRPHHVWKYGTSNQRQLRLGEEKKKIETTGQKYNGLPYYIRRPSLLSSPLITTEHRWQLLCRTAASEKGDILLLPNVNRFPKLCHWQT